MITSKFAQQVRDAFEGLNYYVTTTLDANELQKNAVRTLTHCKEIEDAINVIDLYQFCLKNWDKIVKLCTTKFDLYKRIKHTGYPIINLVSDEEADNTFFITNGINGKAKEIAFASHNFDDQIFAFSNEHGKISVYDIGEYYLKYPKMSTQKMLLFDKTNRLLCEIVLNNNCSFSFKKNDTQYGIESFDWGLGIFNKKYLDSMQKNEDFDPQELVADITWRTIDKNSKFGVSKLTVYSEKAELELLILISASTFLIYANYMQTLRLALLNLSWS